MSYNSIEYIIFLFVIVALFYICPVKYRKEILFVASFAFYSYWNIGYAALLLIVCIVVFMLNVHSNECSDPKRKLFEIISITISLGLLVIFKYSEFMFSSICRAMHLESRLLSSGFFDSIIIPIGISYYVFRCISYSVDVYKRKIDPEHNFVIFALYISFFPTLLTGPIERSKDFCQQIKTNLYYKDDLFKKGTILILFGLFKKIVIADNLAVIVNQAYDSILNKTGMQYLFATICYALEIYCDFSACADMAIGTGYLFGIKLSRNFNNPYFSESIREFWRRWHITLTSWFRDYLYIPLGGNRKGSIRTYINIFIVFIFSGLWHGASLHYVLWGIIHGALQIVEIVLTKNKKNEANLHNFSIIKRIITFSIVCLTWIFFRANSVSSSVSILTTIITRTKLEDISGITELGQSKYMICLLLFLSVVALILEKENENGKLINKLKDTIVVRYIVYYLLIMAILVFGYYGPGFNPIDFVYFRF